MRLIIFVNLTNYLLDVVFRKNKVDLHFRMFSDLVSVSKQKPIEIISQMNTSFPQTNGLYTSVAYEIGLLQGGTNRTITGLAEAFSITPLT